MAQIIDGIEYDSPYDMLGVSFKKREDGKVVMVGFKPGQMVEFGTPEHEDKGIILNIDNRLKLIEVDDGSGIERHCRLRFNPITPTRIYATLQSIPN